MKVSMKRVLTPMICALTGLFNFIFMFLPYTAVMMVGSYGGESENQTILFNAYKMMEFGDESLASGMDVIMQFVGKEGRGSVLLVLVSILFIFFVIMSIALLVFGFIGLLRELGKVDLLSFANINLVTKITKLMLIVNFGLTATITLFSAIACMMNIYSGSFFGASIFVGVVPHVGLFLLLALSIAAWVLDKVLGKKLGAPKAAAPVLCHCASCGNTMNTSMQFCNVCGAANIYAGQVPVSAEPSDADYESQIEKFDFAAVGGAVKGIWDGVDSVLKKNRISMKKLGILCGAVVGVIALIVILCSIPWGGPNYVMIKDDLSGANIDGEAVFLSAGKESKITLDTEIDDTMQSLDGKTVLLYGDDDICYIYQNGKIVGEIEDAEEVKLSVNGAGVVYINEDEELVLYTVKNKKTVTISDELADVYYSYSSYDSYAISPDGKSVAYTEYDSGDYTLYLFKDGKKKKIDENAFPVALSNKGNYVYYVDMEKGALYVGGKKDGVKLSNDASNFVLNADHTQIMFSTDSGRYVSEKGKEKQKITSSSSIYQLGDPTWGKSMDGGNAITSPMESFKNIYFRDSSYTLYYLDGKFEEHEIASNVYSFHTSETGDVLYYLKGDTLYRTESYKKDAKEVAEDVSSFAITSDGSKCYFVDDSDTLFYVKGTGKVKEISEDVDNWAMTHDDHMLFIDEDDRLYSTKNGSKKKTIADDVDSIAMTAVGNYYIADEVLYGTAKGAKFKEIMDVNY